MLTKPSLEGSASLSNILHSTVSFSSSYNIIRSDEVQSKSLLLIMENFLPFTEDVMVVLVHKCAQQTHLLALHLETLGYIPRLLNALNGLVYFLIIGDPKQIVEVYNKLVIYYKQVKSLNKYVDIIFFSLWRCYMGPILGPPWVSGTGEKGHLFQGNRGTKAKF